jgi:hypothetical protein
MASVTAGTKYNAAGLWNLLSLLLPEHGGRFIHDIVDRTAIGDQAHSVCFNVGQFGP